MAALILSNGEREKMAKWDTGNTMAKKVVAGKLLGKKIKQTVKGLATPGYIMTIWDRDKGEIFEIPKGVDEEELDEFFLGLKSRILYDGKPKKFAGCSDTLKCTDNSCEDCEGREGDDPK